MHFKNNLVMIAETGSYIFRWRFRRRRSRLCLSSLIIHTDTKYRKQKWADDDQDDQIDTKLITAWKISWSCDRLINWRADRLIRWLVEKLPN